MKLLIDGRPVRSPLSGSAVFVVNLARAMSKFDVETSIFFQSDRNRNQEIKNLSDLKQIVSHANKTYENLLAEYGFNCKALKSFKELVAHETYFARMPIKAAKKIATIHDVIPLDYPKWFSWRNSHYARKNFYRQMSECDHVVFSSNFTLDRALSYCDEAPKSSVIQLAVSENIQNSFDSYGKEKNLPPKFSHLDQYILMVGNVEPRKNIPIVAEAIGILNNRLNLNLNLVIAGKENFKSQEILVESSRKLGKDPICLGFISEDEKIALYQNTACHVYASKYEGFGIPPVEGLLIGAPTVVAQNTSLLEITPSPEMGFQTDDCLDLVNALERNLFRSPFLDKSIDMNFLKKHFSWTRVADEYYQIYKSL